MKHERFRDIVVYYRMESAALDNNSNSVSNSGPGFAKNAIRATGDTLVASSGASALTSRTPQFKSFVLAFWIKPITVNADSQYKGILSRDEEWLVYQKGQKIRQQC